MGATRKDPTIHQLRDRGIDPRSFEIAYQLVLLQNNGTDLQIRRPALADRIIRVSLEDFEAAIDLADGLASKVCKILGISLPYVKAMSIYWQERGALHWRWTAASGQRGSWTRAEDAQPPPPIEGEIVVRRDPRRADGILIDGLRRRRFRPWRTVTVHLVRLPVRRVASSPVARVIAVAASLAIAYNLGG